MAKKPKGTPPKKQNVKKPTPAKIQPKKHPASQPVKRISNTSLKKNRSKNSVKLENADEIQRMSPDRGSVDEDAQDVLKKPDRESSLHYVRPLPPAKEPSSPYKRKVKRVLFYALTIILLLAVCCILSLTVFFKIDEIEVEGTTRYDNNDIIASSMINKGDNWILCNTGPGEKEIWEKFPYIEKVSIHKKLFDKIVIAVEEAVPTSVIESDGKYVLLSESGKIIDIADSKQTDVPMIMGAKLETPELSSAVHYKNENVEEYLEEILKAADKYHLGTLEIIDISNLAKISLQRQNGLKIILGPPESIDYKMKTAQKIIEKSLSEEDKGILDVSLCSSEGGKSYYNSQKPEESVESSAQSSDHKQQESSGTASQDSSQSGSPSSSSQPESSGTGSEPSQSQETPIFFPYVPGGTGDIGSDNENTDDNTYVDNNYDYNNDDNYDDNYDNDDTDNTYDGGGTDSNENPYQEDYTNDWYQNPGDGTGYQYDENGQLYFAE